jgi:hypothetical protein
VLISSAEDGGLSSRAPLAAAKMCAAESECLDRYDWLYSAGEDGSREEREGPIAALIGSESSAEATVCQFNLSARQRSIKVFWWSYLFDKSGGSDDVDPGDLDLSLRPRSDISERLRTAL